MTFLQGKSADAQKFLGACQPPSRPPRFCDVCVAVHASLYCAADDAYLCRSCDTEVHNANSLAQRHERVRLGPNGAPMKIERKSGGADSQRVKKEDSAVVSVISANSGSSGAVTRKRSKSGKGQHGAISSTITSSAVVSPSSDASAPPQIVPVNGGALAPVMASDHIHQQDFGHASSLPYFERVSDDIFENENHALDSACRSYSADPFPWNARGICGEIGGSMGDIQDFGNYESLGYGGDEVDDGGFAVELGNAVPCAEHYCDSKIECDVEPDTSTAIQHSSVTSDRSCEGERGAAEVMEQQTYKEEVQADLEGAAPHLILFGGLDGFDDQMLSSCPSLRLNYEDVMSAWSDRGGSPWLEEDACVHVEDSDFYDPMGGMENGVVPVLCPRQVAEAGDEVMVTVGDEGLVAENREARVLRYREKRRNRLFSKKVRYEVRKLNAERRPRIKGRFVKRIME